MARLVVVSNRVPIPDKDGVAPAGGLAVALQAALQERGGIWMGWSGKSSGSREPEMLSRRQQGNITYAVTDLTDTDVEEYYHGFANRVLWPICHYRLDLAEYGRKEMAGYFRVNRFFAQRLAPLIEPDDVIWVHDYHLIPLAAELRRIGLKNRIGFFLHIPWPSADVLVTMPVHEEIMRGLSHYDLLGFQTDHDLQNFAGYLTREGIGNDLGDGLFDSHGRTFKSAAYPIGIETAAFAELAGKASANILVRKARQSIEGRDLIIGVDRLDYSKGITQRLDAFERFITTNPAYQNKVTYLQITPKSRSEVPEYEQMQRMVAEQAGRVNGAIGTVDWVPIRYINRSSSRNVLAGLYRLATIGFVTPLRDGMNLVAKEYVAAQDPDRPGVLVLSRFAGAARELKGALLVNPYDVEGTANALARALTMSIEERRERWRGMMDHLLEHDVSRWCNDFLRDLTAKTAAAN
ncbi:alpha,alpha-trehalose-phosphate synthase (UDP-forming) [Rhizobium leguminosarum]|jgi:trehalose 6-phosphate synthase|uniref:Trehalose-6-phosphate synthase n=2 Tax=Rhizobium TaxID=379 RepID=A0A444HLT2_RHILE|nr:MULTISPECIES: alpha,alpha-trehalose-phosphate synthase (UDP-forming) [Rhizobium]MBY5461723.1 alpha,alpha-trehalose-phosphate synthase (UDP-forming) [Rhizobium leguminosarum]NKL65539.1 alpha,alpha-trehalose-phosphate synthase (UDP-forming) [Rhizobium leguminosarum bv. viciae]RWX14920.1 alpha,alpha-trehalose-phosphate synthase (UDP-forming) [Rhizobium leguminosarum]RWX23023.1 alpha,alpha-trehalose-phosphate synthase (UDP-forming) [Rhizobium leguminosarum]TAU43962.1 alpha,alpha-trehalose-phosp